MVPLFKRALAIQEKGLGPDHPLNVASLLGLADIYKSQGRVAEAEPLYLRSTQGQIPELKRVIVAYDDRLAMERTLEAALAAVFRPDAAAPATPPAPRTITAGETGSAPPPSTDANEPAGARDRYRAALEALRGGEWERFGREMDALGKLLGE